MTRRTFLTNIGRVTVDIGDIVNVRWQYGFRHKYPAYRVTIGHRDYSGTDWGVPESDSHDDVDAMLALLRWRGPETSDDMTGESGLSWWVQYRQAARRAICQARPRWLPAGQHPRDPREELRKVGAAWGASEPRDELRKVRPLHGPPRYEDTNTVGKASV